jgi:hypothetical protein
MEGSTFDASVKPGSDGEDWPYINIYGSCKTCEAYILDYFAEEAFEEVEIYKTQAIMYMTGALGGFAATVLLYFKYRISPTAENEVVLLSYDGGALA